MLSICPFFPFCNRNITVIFPIQQHDKAATKDHNTVAALKYMYFIRITISYPASVNHRSSSTPTQQAPRYTVSLRIIIYPPILNCNTAKYPIRLLQQALFDIEETPALRPPPGS